MREGHKNRTDLYTPVAGLPFATSEMIQATRERYGSMRNDKGKPAYTPGAVYNMSLDPRLMEGHQDYAHSGIDRFMIESQHVADDRETTVRRRANVKRFVGDKASRANSFAPLVKGVKGKEEALAAMDHNARDIARGKTQVRAAAKLRGIPGNTYLGPEARAAGSTRKTRRRVLGK